jgi:hypothetical protein
MDGVCSTYRREQKCKVSRTPEGKNHLKDPGVDGEMTLKWLLKKYDLRTWNGFI